MTETRHLRSDAGVACSGLSSPRALGAAQSSLATQLLAAGTPGTLYPWTIEETARSIAAGNWSVTLRIEAGGPNQAAAQVRCVVERRNSSCEVQQTIIDETQGVGTSGISDIVYSATDVDQVDFAAGDRLVVTVQRTNSTNRTATLRFANGSPDDSRLVHPAVAATPVDELAGSLPVEIELAGTLSVPSTEPPTPGTWAAADRTWAEATEPWVAVPSIQGTLPVEVDLAGVLDQPLATVPGVEGELAVEVDLAGTLADPGVDPPSQITGDLAVEVDLGGVLESPGASIPSIAGTLAVELDLAGELLRPVASVPQTAAGLPVILDLGGTLTRPAATVAQLGGTLAVVVDLAGTLFDPTEEGRGRPMGTVRLLAIPVGDVELAAIPTSTTHLDPIPAGSAT